MREGGVSVTHQTGMSKSAGGPVQPLPGQPLRFDAWPSSRPLLPWPTVSRGLRQVGLQGLRCVQFPLLLVRRSFWGLILALNWWDIIDEQVFLGGP